MKEDKKKIDLIKIKKRIKSSKNIIKDIETIEIAKEDIMELSTLEPLIRYIANSNIPRGARIKKRKINFFVGIEKKILIFQGKIILFQDKRHLILLNYLLIELNGLETANEDIVWDLREYNTRMKIDPKKGLLNYANFINDKIKKELNCKENIISATVDGMNINEKFIIVSNENIYNITH